MNTCRLKQLFMSLPMERYSGDRIWNLPTEPGDLGTTSRITTTSGVCVL